MTESLKNREEISNIEKWPSPEDLKKTENFWKNNSNIISDFLKKELLNKSC